MAAGVKNKNVNWLPYTYGCKDFVESEIAVEIAKYYNLSHICSEVENSLYLDYMIDGIAYSGGASLFKHGIQPHLFSSLKKQTNADGQMIGSALDLLVGGTHTPSEIFRLKTRKALLDYYKTAQQKGDVKNYLVAGVSLKCGNGLSIAPNLRMNTYENESDSKTSQAINFQFNC